MMTRREKDEVYQMFPGTGETGQGATELVPMIMSASQVKYWTLFSSLLCPSETGQECKSRQHCYSPQLLRTPPLYNMQLSSPNLCEPSLNLFLLSSSYSKLLLLLPRDSAQVPAPPKSRPLHSALLPVPGSTGPAHPSQDTHNIHTSVWPPH